MQQAELVLGFCDLNRVHALLRQPGMLGQEQRFFKIFLGQGEIDILNLCRFEIFPQIGQTQAQPGFDPVPLDQDRAVIFIDSLVPLLLLSVPIPAPLVRF